MNNKDYHTKLDFFNFIMFGIGFFVIIGIISLIGSIMNFFKKITK